jgi:hypothetical protein
VPGSNEASLQGLLIPSFLMMVRWIKLTSFIPLVVVNSETDEMVQHTFLPWTISIIHAMLNLRLLCCCLGFFFKLSFFTQFQEFSKSPAKH